jgi:hypothetical protein
MLGAISRARTWLSTNLVGQSPDFGAAPTQDTASVGKYAAIGGGVGAAGGAGYAAYSIKHDEPYVRYRNEIVDRASVGPDAADRLGADTASALAAKVRERADSWGTDASVDATVQYLSYLKELRPNTATAILESAHVTLENHLGGDAKVRGALNLISVYLEKNPEATVFDGVGEYLNAYNQVERKGDAAGLFMERFGISQDELKDSVMKMELAHTSPLAQFGLAGGILVGAAGGALVGAGIGAGVAVAINYIKK